MQVRVLFGAAQIEHDLATLPSLRAHIDALCAQFNAPGARDKYTLQLEHSNAYLSEADLRTEGAVPSNAQLRLKLLPKEEATVALANLRDTSKAMKACVDLRSQLKDPAFVREFAASGGVQSVVEHVNQSSGNTLAYALRALEGLLALGFGFRELNAESCVRLIGLLDTGKNNVVHAALEILTHLARHPSVGAALLGHFKLFAERHGRDALTCVVRALDSPDLNTKLPALLLINALVLAAGNERDRLAALKQLLSAGALEAVRAQLPIENADFRAALFAHQLLQHWGMRTDRAKHYDRTNPSHEQLLSLLWRSAYPGEELTARVSEQWKKMGFQGTDPATDFRGMGLLGLKHLLYFACVYKERFRRLLDFSATRSLSGRDYPVAVAGINVSQLVWELLHLGDELPSPARAAPEAGWPLCAALFDHSHALEEIYCAGLELLDRTWDELNASYMDYPKVIAAVRARLAEAITSNPTTLPALLAKLTPTPLASSLHTGPLPHAFLLSCSATASSAPELNRPASPARALPQRPTSPASTGAPSISPLTVPSVLATPPSPVTPIAYSASTSGTPAVVAVSAPSVTPTTQWGVTARHLGSGMAIGASTSGSGSGIAGASSSSPRTAGSASGVVPGGPNTPQSLSLAPPPMGMAAPPVPPLSSPHTLSVSTTSASIPAMSLDAGGTDESAALAGMQSKQAERQVQARLKGRVFADAFDFVRATKLAHLRDTATFKDPRSLVKGQAKPLSVTVRLAESGTEMIYCVEGDATQHTLKVSDMAALATGLACPLWNTKGAKRPDEVAAALCLSVINKEGTSLLDLMAASRSEFAHWSDGLRVLLGGKIEHPETLDDIRTLADMDMDLRLLDLEGVEFPAEAPPVPEPPPDLDFATSDDSTSGSGASLSAASGASVGASLTANGNANASSSGNSGRAPIISPRSGASSPVVYMRSPSFAASGPGSASTTSTASPLPVPASATPTGSPRPLGANSARTANASNSTSPTTPGGSGTLQRGLSSPGAGASTSTTALVMPTSLPSPPPVPSNNPPSPRSMLPPPPTQAPPSPRSAVPGQPTPTTSVSQSVPHLATTPPLSPVPAALASPSSSPPTPSSPAVTKVPVGRIPSSNTGFVRTQPSALKGPAKPATAAKPP